jgi:TatD DNase family protein
MLYDVDVRSRAPTVIGYTLRGNRYLNITNRCTLRCAFCPKFNKTWTVEGYDLRLRQEPDTDEILAAVGNSRDYNEVVFCGMGEPTLRLYTLLNVAGHCHARGGRVRLNTDGLANLVHGRDVTPDLEGNLDAISVSINAQDAVTYNRHCRPKMEGAHDAVLNFIRCAREYVPDITITAIDGLAGVDITGCEQIARRLGVKFRRRVLGQVG